MSEKPTSEFNPLDFLQIRRIETLLEPTRCTDSEEMETASLALQPHWQTDILLFIENLVQEQLQYPEKLLKLDSTRRNSIALFLCELAKKPETQMHNVDPVQILNDFVRIDRTEAEHEALKTLFRQIAWVQVGKAFLLRSWNTTQITELKNLTASLEKILRPFLHLQTATFQLVQRNFFSWYTLNEDSQNQLWQILESAFNQTPSHQIKEWILGYAIRTSASMLGEPERYTSKFYKPFWNATLKGAFCDPRLSQYQELGLPIYGFSPSIRDGSLFEHAPKDIHWIGFEPLSFELIFAEIRKLWGKPCAPSLWTKGCGLEMNMELQSGLLVTDSGKKNVLHQIDQISSCEFSFITEEITIRTQGRTRAAQALRKLIDQHGILKKLKHPQTTRGMYQACQALGKLRQGGLLFWSREELLNEDSGKPALTYLLNEAKLLTIIDLSAMNFTQDSSLRIPKAIYILKKESSLEERKNHRPVLLKAFGTLETEAHIQLLFDRCIKNIENPEIIFPPEPFTLTARLSPVSQHEWEQHWFNPTDNSWVEEIENLKRNSQPIGKWAVIKPVMPSEHSLDPFNRAPLGFYLWAESRSNGAEIMIADHLSPPLHLKQSGAKSSHLVFWVTPLNAANLLVLRSFFKSNFVQNWLNYSAERKKGLWSLKESDLKAIPTPLSLSPVLDSPEQELPVLPAPHQQLFDVLAVDPSRALQAFAPLFSEQPHLRGWAFKKASEALAFAEQTQTQLSNLVGPTDELNWSEFIQHFVPSKDLTTIDQNPHIRFSSSIPMHLPVQDASIVKAPSPAILLIHARGLTQPLYIQHAWLRELVHQQILRILKDKKDATFFELCKLILVPRNPDQVVLMGHQVLKSAIQDRMKRKELIHLMNTALSSQQTKPSEINLLQ